MADVASLEVRPSRWKQAFDQVDLFFAAYEGVTRLGKEAARLYPARTVRDGWRVPVAFSGGTRRFDILVGEQFPHALPRFVLVDRPPYRTWPHIEADGSLCLLPNGTPVSFNDPVALVQQLLAQAVELVEAGESGRNLDDFRVEFITYWPIDHAAPLIRSLLTPGGPSRPIAVHRSFRVYTVAEDAGVLAGWLANAFSSKSDHSKTIDLALLVWLDEPFLPTQYPVTSADVATYVHSVGLGPDLERLAGTQTAGIVVIFGATTKDGPTFVATVLSRNSNARSRAPDRGGPERGFRPGKTPPDVFARRVLGASRVAPTIVQRIDAAWIHGRERDPDFPTLRSAKVVIVGCGSVGGPVAIGLAQAGVGSLNLIDPDFLTAANVGRHPLGIPHIDRYKAKELGQRIREDYPHVLHCEGVSERWEEAQGRTPAVFADADLIISTTGEWAAEAALNAWRQNRGGGPDLLFGWTEAHAVAGHAVGLMNGEGCLACGFTPWGEPMLPVAAWPHGTGRSAEPGCGAVFQPYGPVEVAHVTAMIIEAAVDMLLGRADAPFHRTWVARQPVLDRAQAAWSEAWLVAHEGSPKNACLEERVWRPRPRCPYCTAAA